MPLSILVGILNTGKTFPFGFCFITSETTSSFEFMEQQLDDLFFYNCPRPKVICGDFAKGLASAIAKREAQHHADGNTLKNTNSNFVSGIDLKQLNVILLL